MSNIYVLAPYSAHAELAVREEKAFGRWQGHDFHAIPFRDLKRIVFHDGDIVMVRGLRAVQSVHRMKNFTVDFITQASYMNLVPLLIGLDNYELRTRDILVMLNDEKLRYERLYKERNDGQKSVGVRADESTSSAPN